MPSTYSNLGIELIASGDQAGTWGTTTNTNLGTLIDQAIAGYTTTACTGGTDTITIPNGATGVARNMFLELTGTGGGSLVVPTNKKLYFIYNNTSAAITVKVTTGVSVPAGAKTVLVCNGTDIVVAANYLASLTLGAALPVASGGSGVTSATAYAVLCGGTTSTNPIQAIASVGTTGQVLTSNGAGALPTMQAAVAVVAGAIMMWPTSTAPTGYLLCNGAAVSRTTYSALFAQCQTTFGAGDLSTTFNLPNYTDKMPYGAGGFVGVGATGGSANSSLPSHTHTATVTDPSHVHTYTFKNTTGGTLAGGDANSVNNTTFDTGAAVTGITVSNSTEGVSPTNTNIPPYLAIYFIIKT